MHTTRKSALLLLVVLVLAASSARMRGAPQGSAPTPAPQDSTAPQPAQPAPSAAPSQGDTPPQPTFREGINFVRVDVIVTDKKAQPITDLTQADFEVLEDGKPQRVEQFRLVKIDGIRRPGDPPPSRIRNRADEEQEAARDDVRVFAIFLDDYHVRLGNSMAIREPLMKFIETLGENDLVGIMYPLTPIESVTFTRDRRATINAIRQFQGRKYDYKIMNDFEARYSQAPAEIVERVRNEVVISALRGLSIRMGGLREGRKSIVHVSEGPVIQLPAGMRSANAQQPLGMTTGRRDDLTESRAEFMSMSDLIFQYREVFDSANRNNAAIYTLDPRGLAVFEYQVGGEGIGGPPGLVADNRSLTMGQDMLRTLAEETDGRAIVNQNNFANGLAQMLRDSSAYYLIGYTSSQAPSDGRFHEIKVRVKRPNVDVRARKGYWAHTVADAVRAATKAPEIAKPIQEALASIAPVVQAGKYVRTWIGTERGANGKTRVTMIWEPLPQVAAARREQPGRVSLLAADAKGDVVFRGRTPEAGAASPVGAAVAPAPATVSPATAGGGASMGSQMLSFESAPGKLELRTTVEGVNGTGTLDSEIRAFEVPDLTAPQAGLSTPRVYRARNARDFQALVGDAAVTPVAGREFSRTERLLIRFSVYGAGSEQPVPAAVLMNRAGQKMADLTVGPAAAGGTHQIDVGLNTMPPGEYLIRVTVKGASGEAEELIPLRITS